MGKYKFFGNSRTKGPHGEEHPSIDLGYKKGKWENLEVTSSPIKGKPYIEFDENPNPNWRERNDDGTPKKRSFFRKYVRKDPKYVKLTEYKNYSLVPVDENKVDSFLNEREKNKLIDKQRREAALKRKQTKNDAKLRYHQSGRSASQHRSAHASLESFKQKKLDKSRKK